MTLRRAPRHLQGLPTLTEVVDLPPLEPALPAATAPSAEAQQPEPPVAAQTPSVRLFDEAELAARVLVELQRQVEPMLDQRLREVIEPALVRASESLVRELRAELTSTLNDAVTRAVSQELARRRTV